jgi:hypothetical protein
VTLTAAAREKIRRLIGALLISLGTAVFSGAVAVLVDGLINSEQLRWAYITVFTVAGLLLSGGGAWLLATLRTAVGIGVATTDEAGDPDRYQDEADAFARFGEGVFTALTSLFVPVNDAVDLPSLRNRLLAVLRALTQVHRQTAVIGLLFQGRHQVGFHLGKWLNVAGRRIDLYADARDGSRSHFLAVRLTPAIQTAPRPLDVVVYTAAEGAFGPGQHVTIDKLGPQLASLAGGCMCLAINVNGPVGEAGLIEPTQRSALTEGANVLVAVAPPAPPGQRDASRRELAPTLAEFESTVAAILAVADQMPASPGLLYFKTPAVISVALGHFLRAGTWIPMRHIRTSDGTATYERFTDPSRR